MKLSKEFEIIKIIDNTRTLVQDSVIVQHSLALYLNDRYFTTLLCTPSDLEALVYGTLFTRGIIQSRADLKSLQIQEERAEVVLKKEINLEKRQEMAEPCSTQVLPMDPLLNMEDLFSAVKAFEDKSPLFAATGGVHSCALCHSNGGRIFMEDIGRHNAVDKAFGNALLEDWDLAQAFLITSGRVPGDLICKALNTGLPIIISRSAPTHRAVELASQSNVTLCGFARGRRLNIYSAPERILP